MSIEQHHANRSWAFDALNTLNRFVSDGDIEGPVESEISEIEAKRRNLLEGKYRTLILGAFNVGKSTLVNAYLGEEYLPTILEECTTKLTHVVRGDDMRTVLRMNAPATEDELNALRDVHRSLNIFVDVSQDSHRGHVVMAYPEHNPKSVNGTLKTLITMSSDEDFPNLATLRTKFEELFVYIPNERIADDVSLIDSPGVHSIVHTNNRIAREVVPSSHLVICMLDSQNAGNEQSRDFIANVIQPANRKVFFVINKADHLTDQEIDPTGHRGPGKDLVRSLAGVVKNPEIFFVSSLYALAGEMLASGRATLDEIDMHPKIRIPFAVHKELQSSPDPVKATAQYLLARSNFAGLRHRIHEYLYTENAEGAMVDSVCNFVDETAWKYTRPLEMKLEQAKNIPKLEDLQKNRTRLDQQLSEFRGNAERIRSDNEDRQKHCKTVVDDLFDKLAIEDAVLKPIRNWIDSGENFKNAKRQGYKPLASELERLVGEFIDDVQRRANREVESVETVVRGDITKLLGDSAVIDKREPISVSKTGVVALHAEMGSSYLGFGIVGALLGAAGLGGAGFALVNDNLIQSLQLAEKLGGATLPPAQQVGAIGGGLAGLILGGIIGLIVRSGGADAVRKEKLNKAITEKVEQMLSTEVLGQLREAVESRSNAFTLKVTTLLDKGAAAIQSQITAINNEEAELKQMQAGAIQRITPKLETLATLSKKAREIIQWGAAKKGRN
ncbi:MAG: dynamin family protein [Candidatus Hydrogenedentes bacterium]|nr:dynamin family protein [Candidatus Hydrogenedentota bacterium]